MQRFGTAAICLAAVLLAAGCRAPVQDAPAGPRTVRVVQSGSGDMVGNDNFALQKAADMLRPGDTLDIGPGTYTMHNSLFVPSKVTVRGVPGQTILVKSAGVESLLLEDGDYGECQLRVAEPRKFQAGMGISVVDDAQKQGWDISVTTVKAVEGSLLRLHPMTLRDYDSAAQHARVRNTFPILCAINAEGVTFEGITVDGNKDQNELLDGCRGGAIYAHIARDVTIRNCVARNYHGDGISFQITDNVQVIDCESYGHTGLGIHPGTGSDRPTVKNCRIHDNGETGLYLCWRVRHGQFTDNVIEQNGRYGISIGHKDTDNLFVNNTVTRNGFCGVLFRQETIENSGHRNTFRNNKVLDNGNAKEGYGFYILPHAEGLSISNNRVSETRAGDARTQRYGIYKVAGAGPLRLESNTISGCIEKDILEK